MSVVPQSRYFEWRRVTPEMYAQYQLPAYFELALPPDKRARIVDYGCGFGQVLTALAARGYSNVVGLDIEPSALAYCKGLGLEVYDNGAVDATSQMAGTADLVIMSHVIEHFPKERIIPLLQSIRTMLKPDGRLFVMVPNAQAHTGCYWAYEDFTHEFLFTSGSLYYVLKAAGFNGIEFIDKECLAGCSPVKRMLRRLLLWVYRRHYIFWSKVTASGLHAPSELIFSYEIKALAMADESARRS